MADIYCRFCGEPWDHDCLHDFDDYPKRIKLWKKYGCPALQEEATPTDQCRYPASDPTRALQSQALQELSDYSDDWVVL
ncbi:MAG: hypothetical protein Unbinned4834contig1000_42 [Prokaryotic dsDNA virus sp.]|nr:MAG: hypothetical protein Unbinned4834contig1000_42 [Prokaryotic dsDNA virus sp.]